MKSHHHRRQNQRVSLLLILLGDLAIIFMVVGGRIFVSCFVVHIDNSVYRFFRFFFFFVFVTTTTPEKRNNIKSNFSLALALTLLFFGWSVFLCWNYDLLATKTFAPFILVKMRFNEWVFFAFFCFFLFILRPFGCVCMNKLCIVCSPPERRKKNSIKYLVSMF